MAKKIEDHMTIKTDTNGTERWFGLTKGQHLLIQLGLVFVLIGGAVSVLFM